MFIFVYDCFIVFVLGQIRVRIRVLQRTVRVSILGFQIVVGFTADAESHLFFHPGLIIGRVLFQFFDIRSFVILRPGDEAHVDPAAYQIGFIHIIGCLCFGKGIQQTAIAFFFFQENVTTGTGIYRSRIRIRAVSLRHGIHDNILLKRADTPVLTGQGYFQAPHRCRGALLGNISVCRQHHVAGFSGRIKTAADQFLDNHIAGQGLAGLCDSLYGNINVAAVRAFRA